MLRIFLRETFLSVFQISIAGATAAAFFTERGGEGGGEGQREAREERVVREGERGGEGGRGGGRGGGREREGGGGR